MMTKPTLNAKLSCIRASASFKNKVIVCTFALLLYILKNITVSQLRHNPINSHPVLLQVGVEP